MSTSCDPLNILISLHKGYGLGDAVSMSAVLRHVRAAYPHWEIDYRAEEGFHTAGNGIVNKISHYGEFHPETYIDAEVQILLHDVFPAWADRPNTRVTSCLHERFGLPWRPELGRYHINVSDESREAARTRLTGGTTQKDPRDRNKSREVRLDHNSIVAIHYQGDSASHMKDLTHSQADDICRAVIKLGYAPLIIDFKNKSPLSCWRLTTPSHWGRDCEMMCALISQCRAFVGIDSGPAKCASATETPSLAVWTGHHPAVFHDPAPNTTHLVPKGYHSIHPVSGNMDVARWFEDNYRAREYKSDPVGEIQTWLREVLKR